MILTLIENTNKNEKSFLFVWYFAHLIVSLHPKYISDYYDDARKNTFYNDASAPCCLCR